MSTENSSNYDACSPSVGVHFISWESVLSECDDSLMPQSLVKPDFEESLGSPFSVHHFLFSSLAATSTAQEASD
jgi:hypothetical protein